MYHDNPSSRSPGSQRNQQQPLNRQPSRQFDAYGPMPSNLYEDPLARYDNNRVERLSPLPSNTHYNYDMPGSQTWNPNGFSGAHSLSSMNSATGRIKPTTRRTGLPSTWLDQQPVSQPQPQQQQQPAPTNHFGGSLAPGQPTGQHAGQHTSSHAGNPTNTQQDGEDELIPTAIVIKNIPFAVKKEQLVQLMTDMNLPLPYAFNYHFDNGVFRGLAFANFTTAEETATVIEVLNHFELQGRKLRVEYKKMLPLQERERIEREKRERRGQLEEQHRPMAASQLQHNTLSLSHAPATSPSPVSNRNSKLEVDLNDSQTLQFYNELLLFKEDPKREVLIFPPTLTPLQRRTVHTLAHNMGLFHASRGTGDQRQVHVFRVPPDSISPPLSSVPSTVQAADAQRRGLNRAATIDFGEARSDNPAHYGTMRGHNSAFLGVMDSANGFANSQNLRAAKSFADLRSYTPSPVPSSASFPATLQSNGNRLQQPFDGTTSAASNTPTLTPTPSGSSLGMPQRDENLLVNNLGSLSLGTGLGPSGSPRRLRGMFSWEQQQQQQQPQQQQQQDGQSMSPGAIGSNRPIGVGFDSQPQERLPLRQPRGPAPDRGAGFRRQNGHQSRGSEELRTNSGVEIIVE